jgi:hypothetical protein
MGHCEMLLAVAGLDQKALEDRTRLLASRDWVCWSDFALDAVGTQGQESKVFAVLLSRAIGVPIAPPSRG